ncbi:MAG: SpoIIE family protein phosphatase [Acidobacteriota bacterium]
MEDRSVSQTQRFHAVDFSRPTPWTSLLLSLSGLLLVLLFYKPFALGSAVERSLLPTEAASLGLKQLRAFGVNAEENLVTALPIQDEPLILFVRDQFGARQGNEQLKTTIPGTFWEVTLRSRDDYTTALEWKWRVGHAGRITDGKEVHRALIRIDEQGRWFQFYQRGNENESGQSLSDEEALKIAIEWAQAHTLYILGEQTPFLPDQMGRPVVVFDGSTHRFHWALDSPIEGLKRQVTIEVTGKTVSYYGLEFQPPSNYPTQYASIWRFTLLLRIVLLVMAVFLVFFLLIKQLRRDAIDFDFSFTYSTLLTFPLIALIIADLPALMNEEYVTVIKENFYLLSTSAFIWFVLLLLAIPVVALTDSLVRQAWHEKLSTFDALIRGRFGLPAVGRATLIGISAGISGLGVTMLGNTLLARFGGYTHGTIFTFLNGPLASLWAVFGSLGLALISSYILLFIAILIKQRVRAPRLVAILTALVWLVLLSTTGGRYSNLLAFSVFALVGTTIALYLLFRYDLLTVIAAIFSYLVCPAAVQLLFCDNSIYVVNGVATLVVLGGIVYSSKILAERVDGLPDREFVPQYITRLQSRERIERDVEIARELQYQFLPQKLPKLTRLEVATLCRPAYEVGGDYYDFIELDDKRLGLVIADVSGKGIPAAFYMTMIKGIIQSRALEEVTPRDLLKQINWVIYKNTGSNTFVTLFYAIIDTERATLIYSNAGHNPPFIISCDGQIRELSCGGMVLGVMPRPEYQEEVIELRCDDLILFYTDGVIETTDVLGSEFGPQRLASLIMKRDGRPITELINDICKALDTFAAGAPQNDDITMILVSYKNDEKTDYRN